MTEAVEPRVIAPSSRGLQSLTGAIGLYGLCTGLARGAPLLCLPLLTRALGLADFGIYSLIMVSSQLAVPLLTLNGAAAVEREGATDVLLGQTLLRGFVLLVALATAVALPLALLVDTSATRWVTYAVAFGALESLHILALTWLRMRNRPASYAAFTVAKVSGLVALLWAAAPLGWGLRGILAVQAGWYALVAAAVLVATLELRTGRAYRAVRSVLPYTLPLVPHAAAQWLMSSSDRVIIKAVVGDAAVGLYSIAYSLASVLLIVNSGIALALPPFMFRSYERWLGRDQRAAFLTAYSAGALLIAGIVLTALQLDRDHLGWIGSYDPVLPVTCGLVLSGLYLLGSYLLYTNVLAYRRQTARLAMATVAAAVLNILLTFVLVAAWGIIGAAAATLAAYAVYLLLVAGSAHRIEPALERWTMRERLIGAGTIAAITLMAALQTLWWSR